MQIAPAPNPTFDAYYQTLNSYAAQGVTHEQATRLAFTHLLETYAKPVNWTLVLEQRLSNGKIPDGTLLGDFRIPRGYWEAKDTGDDLDAEVRAKTNSATRPTTSSLRTPGAVSCTRTARRSWRPICVSLPSWLRQAGQEVSVGTYPRLSMWVHFG